MRGLLEFFSIFDWITPSIGFVEDILNDPTPFQSNTWAFFVPYRQSLGSGWNANNVERLLRQHGIHTWGGQITNGEFFFSVKLDQANWAEYLLRRNGVPLNERYACAPPPKRSKRRQQPQKKPASANDFFSSVDHWLDDILR